MIVINYQNHTWRIHALSISPILVIDDKHFERVYNMECRGGVTAGARGWLMLGTEWALVDPEEGIALPRGTNTQAHEDVPSFGAHLE